MRAKCCVSGWVCGSVHQSFCTQYLFVFSSAHTLTVSPAVVCGFTVAIAVFFNVFVQLLLLSDKVITLNKTF